MHVENLLVIKTPPPTYLHTPMRGRANLLFFLFFVRKPLVPPYDYGITENLRRNTGDLRCGDYHYFSACSVQRAGGTTTTAAVRNQSIDFPGLISTRLWQPVQ